MFDMETGARKKNSPPLTLPAGTQVVTRTEIRNDAGEVICPIGAVGVIIASPPDHRSPYLVQFLNGFEIHLPRSQISVRRRYHQDGIERFGRSALSQVNLFDSIIYRCIIGSRAYGLDNEASDTDVRGIYLPPAELHWSLYSLPEQLENEASQECYWELEKFISLALRANPNVLECLYTPLTQTITPVAQELLNIRVVFLSQMIYQTYNGYVISQFKKLEQDLRVHGTIRWKHAMHLVRLLLSGITILREGFVPLRVDTYREQLLAVRSGKIPWGEINAWRLSLHQEFDAALKNSILPEQPDYARANDFLLTARRSMVK
jgi:uncharacterized protein